MTDVPYVFEWLQHFIFWATVVSVLLPPTEVLDGFPRAKAYYTVAVRVTEYMSGAVRGKLYGRLGNGQGRGDGDPQNRPGPPA